MRVRVVMLTAVFLSSALMCGCGGGTAPAGWGEDAADADVTASGVLGFDGGAVRVKKRPVEKRFVKKRLAKKRLALGYWAID